MKIVHISIACIAFCIILNVANAICQPGEIPVSVFMTGISGMIGSHVSYEIIHGRNCYVLYGMIRPRSDISALAKVINDVNLVTGSLNDVGRLERIISDICPKHVYHFAAQAINGLSISMPELTMSDNVQGTLNLFEAIRKSNCSTYPKVIVAGSSTEYGKTAELYKRSLSEDDPLNPVSPYGISKLTTEKIADMYWISHKIPTVTARFFIQIGVGGTDFLAIHQFSKQIAMIEAGRMKPVLKHGNLNSARDMTDASDSAKVVVKLMELGVPGEAYNIGSGNVISMEKLLDSLIQMSTVQIEKGLEHSRLRSFDEALVVANVSKIEKLTGWVASKSIDSSLVEILNYWRNKVKMLYCSDGQCSKPFMETNYIALGENITAVDTLIVNSLTKKCSLANFDIFLPLSHNGFQMFSILLNSINMFMPCFGTLHLIIDRKDSGKAFPFVGESSGQYKIVIHPFDYPPDFMISSSPRGGYILQAWVMFYADEYSKKTGSNAEYIMFLDADSVLGLPVTCSSTFDEKGRIYMPGWSINQQAQFKPGCLDFLGTSCDVSYMAFFPFTLPTSSLARMRAHTLNYMKKSSSKYKNAKSFDDAFNIWTKSSKWGDFSQFVIMGEYMRVYEPDKVAPVFCEHTKDINIKESTCGTYVPNGVHFGWGSKYYIGSGPDGKRASQRCESEFKEYENEKYGYSYISDSTDLMLRGFCLKKYWETGSVHELCNGVSLDTISKELDLYPTHRKLDMDVMKAKFTPDWNGPLCNQRIKKSLY